MNIQSAAAALLFAVLFTLLTGCSESVRFPGVETSPTSSEPQVSTGVLKGVIHGGQQPIVGARIYLFAAGTTGYGSASTSLLTTSSYAGYPTQMDTSNRYYVTTDGAGFFQIADNCTPGQQVYVASIGGNPGSGLNSAANEIAILGQCPAAGNFDSTLTGVLVSEISTVAAAFSAAGYAVDTFHIGGPSSSTIQQTGIANAFANAANLFDVQNFNDLARTSTLGNNGTVPQAKVQTLANILAACVNSTGPTSSACSTLFSNAKTSGSTGTAPVDVATAAINIAHNPWANVTNLYGLQTSTAPFSTKLGTQPNDLSIALDFPNAALGSDPSLAIDGLGNVWTVVPGAAAVTKLSPTGAFLSSPSGYAIGGGFTNARGLAVDSSNNVWVLGLGQTTASIFGFTPPGAILGELSNTGVYVKLVVENALFPTHPPSAATNLVLDNSGNFYFSASYTVLGFPSTTCCTEKYNLATGTFTDLDNGNASPGTNLVAVSNTSVWATSNGASVSETSGAGNRYLTGGGLNGTSWAALDSAGNGWIVNSGGASVSKFSSTGTALSGTSGYTGGLATPKGLAIDGLGTAWVTNSAGTLSLSEFTNAGAVVGVGFNDPALSGANAVALDPSGNIWIGSLSSAAITEYVGAAAPVVTPMATAITAGTLGTRP